MKRDFFNRPTLAVARELLGKFLVRQISKRKIAVMITETEAYCGPSDLASHASRGRTPRNEAMFGPPGHAYIYLIYGMYHCLNIVTEKENYPAAVLLRGVESVNGPGKLCRELQIDKFLNREDITISQSLWLEDRGVKIHPRQIRRTPRIGVDYAGKYKDKPWRFVLGLKQK